MSKNERKVHIFRSVLNKRKNVSFPQASSLAFNKFVSAWPFYNLCLFYFSFCSALNTVKFKGFGMQ